MTVTSCFLPVLKYHTVSLIVNTAGVNTALRILHNIKVAGKTEFN